MKPLNKAGFTIIETMLFLGISGLLLAGILVGTGTQISIQRYRDSVTSLQSFLQQQYSEVSNVSNDSSNNSCSGTDKINRGQSDCFILGRLIRTDPNNSGILNVEGVVGSEPTGSTALLDDVSILLGSGYNIQVSSAAANSTYTLEWNTLLAQTKLNNSKSAAFSILIVRSPSSGLIKTFIDSSHSVSDSELAKDMSTTDGNMSLSKSVAMCVNPNGLLSGATMAVQVDAYATSASGVESLGNGNGC